MPYSEAASTRYDFVGKVIQTKQSQTVNSIATTVDKYYTYDHAGRLETTDQQIAGDANGKVTVAQNIYNEIGQLVDKKLHKAGSFDYLQSVDYTYNIRGWLTSINNPDNLAKAGDPTDLFGEKLLYETFETGLGTSSLVQYNGNISAMAWTSTNKTKRGYGFTYDGLNRLTLGDFKGYNTAWVDSANYEEKSLAYDLNGNINRLVRTNSSGDDMANYTYAYNGNKLASITTNGIINGTTYDYDKNGNTTTDGLRRVSVAYNILNLPKTVSKNSDIITYIYSAAGEKLAKKKKEGTYQYYAGNMVYNNDRLLDYLLFDEGLVTKTSSVFSYEYHLKDHLGNTRVTFQPNGSTTTTTQVADYYPFGSSYLPISPAGTNKYLYNGKEKQDDVLDGTALDWYDYGARMYDPMIGRWQTIDPMIEAHQNYTPYAYVYNNPIKLIDPLGLDSTYYNATGSVLYQATGDKGKTSCNYVTKTTQTTDEMYGADDGTNNNRGNSKSITPEEAQATEDQIKGGNLSGDLMKNVVKLNNTTTMEAMVNIVSKDDSSGGTSANNNREFVGKISNGQVIEDKPGSVGDPSKKQKLVSYSTAGPNETRFHSHPSGTKSGFSWVQPPSKQDIAATTGRINYVMGMKNGHQTIYVYNKTGVIATIPLSIFKK